MNLRKEKGASHFGVGNTMISFWYGLNILDASSLIDCKLLIDTVSNNDRDVTYRAAATALPIHDQTSTSLQQVHSPRIHLHLLTLDYTPRFYHCIWELKISLELDSLWRYNEQHPSYLEHHPCYFFLKPYSGMRLFYFISFLGYKV